MFVQTATAVDTLGISACLRSPGETEETAGREFGAGLRDWVPPWPAKSGGGLRHHRASPSPSSSWTRGSAHPTDGLAKMSRRRSCSRMHSTQASRSAAPAEGRGCGRPARYQAAAPMKRADLISAEVRAARPLPCELGRTTPYRAVSASRIAASSAASSRHQHNHGPGGCPSAGDTAPARLRGRLRAAGRHDRPGSPAAGNAEITC